MAMFAEMFEAPMALWPFALLFAALGLTAVFLLRMWIKRERNDQ
jgi:hypothetical protein